MSSWQEETASDLDAAAKRIGEAIETISGQPNEAQLKSIWRAYLLVEKSVVFVKLALDQEDPGRLVRIPSYSVPDERQALQFALRNITKGRESFRVGDLAQTLRELREGRNYLRVLLRKKRLESLRRARG